MQNKKARTALHEMITRGEYLVVQGNDLAKSFGNLKAFEHKILDYCFSYVKKDSLPEERFTLETSSLLKFLDLTSSGTNYERVVRAFKTLNENTALYLPIEKKDGTRGIRMTQLFAYIDYDEQGKIDFEFSKYAQPFVFDLKNNFYSFHLRELANIKGKYALIMLKLWESHRFGNNKHTIINGTLEEWQEWFLGKDRRLTAGRFKEKILSRAAEELESKFDLTLTLTTEKKGRVVVGYELEIVDNKYDSNNRTAAKYSDESSILDLAKDVF
ncbi:replication initiation protein [Streptococcus suis]